MCNIRQSSLSLFAVKFIITCVISGRASQVYLQPNKKGESRGKKMSL
jgi:hypothetical protein